MVIEFEGKYGFNHQPLTPKKLNNENASAAAPKTNNIHDGAKAAQAADNKYIGEKTDLLTPEAFYASLGLELNTKKDTYTQLVGPKVMALVAKTPQDVAANISETVNNAFDNIIADDSNLLFAMAGLPKPVNAPSLENMQKTLNESPFINKLFA